MKIQIGEVQMESFKQQKVIIKSIETEEEQTILPSKTTKYLLPCLKEYGVKFTKMINLVYKVAAGIGDAILINRDIKHEKHVFLLLDGKMPTYNKHLATFLDWIKDQPMYVDDYVYGDIQKSTFHMVILQLPEKYYNSFETFKKGEYSKMYSIEDVVKFFENHPVAKAVLIKDHEYRVVFTGKVNKRYNTCILPTEFIGELDFRPTTASEIFNHHLKT
jgi:hypothetical protein